MKIRMTLIILCIITSWGFSEETKQMEIEKKEIINVARNYIDGWYEGNAERMKQALHPNLAKRQITGKPDSQFLSPVSASALIEYTKMGYGKLKDGRIPDNKVIVLDIYHNMAMVKTISPKFIDYIHLAKINGQWKIVNVLWEVNYEMMENLKKQ